MSCSIEQKNFELSGNIDGLNNVFKKSQIDSLENIQPLCETLVNEGINIIELALRTNVSLPKYVRFGGTLKKNLMKLKNI